MGSAAGNPELYVHPEVLSGQLLNGFGRDHTYAKTSLELIGHTPLVRLNVLTKDLDATVLAKLESYEPNASVKDRIGLAIIEDAEKQGLISPDKTVILDVTSGNTGIGLVVPALLKGYRTVFVMPAYYSVERRITLLALGAELVITAPELGVPGAVEKLTELLESIPGAWYAGQFVNQANVTVHYQTTGPEIWRQTGGKVDAFVTGAGTGGTITGVGRYLKEQNPNIQVIAVEPAESPLIQGGQHTPHLIQGLGPGFVPEILDLALLDETISVSSKDAIATARKLTREEGLFSGISSGASAFAAFQYAARPENKGKTIVTLFPSYGERYQSTEEFRPEREIALPVSTYPTTLKPFALS